MFTGGNTDRPRDQKLFLIGKIHNVYLAQIKKMVFAVCAVIWGSHYLKCKCAWMLKCKNVRKMGVLYSGA